MADRCARCGAEEPERKLYPPEEWIEYLIQQRVFDDPEGSVSVPLCRTCHDRVAPLRDSFRDRHRLPPDHREDVVERTEDLLADLDLVAVEDEGSDTNWTRWVRERADAADVDLDPDAVGDAERTDGAAARDATGQERDWRVAPPAVAWIAWGVVVGADLGVLGRGSLLVVHGLVLVVLALVARRIDTRARTIGPWRRIFGLGTVATILGAFGLLVTPIVVELAAVSLAVWALGPTIGLIYTGVHADDGDWLYLACGACSAVGAGLTGVGVAVWAPATLPGLVLVGLGQTTGIGVAASRASVPTGVVDDLEPEL